MPVLRSIGQSVEYKLTDSVLTVQAVCVQAVCAHTAQSFIGVAAQFKTQDGWNAAKECSHVAELEVKIATSFLCQKLVMCVYKTSCGSSHRRKSKAYSSLIHRYITDCASGKPAPSLHHVSLL